MAAQQLPALAVFTATGLLLHLLVQRTSRKRRARGQSAPVANAIGPATSEQQDAAETAVQQLQNSYAAMAARFESSGLDLPAIAETAAWFDLGPPAPWPRRYSCFTPKPLPPASVRLMIVPLAACSPRLASLGAAIAADILGQLPAGCKVFSNGRQNLHITVFHFSHPADPRPDSLQQHSGLAHLLPPTQPPPQQQQQQEEEEHGESAMLKLAGAAVAQHAYYITATAAGSEAAAAAAAADCRDMGACNTKQQQQQLVKLDPAMLPPPHERPGPTPSQLVAEQSLAAAVLGGTAPPIPLRVERVLLASSGVLLLTWSDPSGRLGRLRQQLQASFPGACSKQSNIIHTSLFRIVATPPAAAPPPPQCAAGAAAARPSAAGAAGNGHQQQQQPDEGDVLSNMLVSPQAAAAGTGAAGNWKASSSSSSSSEPGGQLSQEAIRAIAAACQRWTDKVAGQQLLVDQLWWVTEEEFSTVEGQRMPMALGTGTGC